MPHFADGGMMDDPAADMGMGAPPPEQEQQGDDSELLQRLANAPRPPAAFVAWLNNPPAQPETNETAAAMRALFDKMGDGMAGGIWLLLTRVADEEPSALSPELRAMVDQAGGTGQAATPATSGPVRMPPMPPGIG